MRGGLTHRLKAHPGPGPLGESGRRYVARRGATGLRVLVHHPYGRVARLAPGRRAGHLEAVADAAPADAFASPAEAAAAIARDALRRPPDPMLCDEIARLLDGPAPRVELDEEDVRALAGRLARVA